MENSPVGAVGKSVEMPGEERKLLRNHGLASIVTFAPAGYFVLWSDRKQHAEFGIGDN